MTRIAKIPASAWPKALSDAVPDNASELELGLLRIMANAPGMAEAFLQFGAELSRTCSLPRRLVELVRLRIAYHNQCRSCMAIRYQSAVDDGVTEDLVCSLERPYEAPGLTERERAALAYADLSATDHLSIADRDFNALRLHFSESEIVQLGMMIALFIGFGRLSAAWDMVEELPTAFQNSEASIGPWFQESVILRG